ncbi:MAG TPA: carboxy terminal-processing peptidase, partial [Gammaproteobacteria bacterium]|nr:carboxy terminal-processing peptidase [Gammaproteobacteria bacterium]
KDQDWRLFMDALRQADTERAETSLSLVLATRQKQQAEDDAKRLTLANAWRKLKGLPPATTLEAALKLPKGADEADAPALEPDVLLDESAQIVADIGGAGLFQGPPGSSLADRNN